ncbi:MAG: hypothetical protein B6245_00775 [Desulfobacteraceae bacterium 4572_88]|nr:MAG: hypothetical protein B6245_00775 [Desulfobacteraceae bacterium 4572_88]
MKNSPLMREGAFTNRGIDYSLWRNFLCGCRHFPFPISHFPFPFSLFSLPTSLFSLIWKNPISK